MRIPGSHPARITRIGVAAGAVVAFSLLTWVGALVRVPVPGTPVPLTLQTVSVLVAGAVLGPGAGGLSQFLYLILGSAGAPAFAGGESGWSHLAGPTGGYLVGFVLAAVTVGWMVRRRRDPGLGYLVLCTSAGSLVVFGAGVVHLSLFLGGDLPRAAVQGALIFLPWDLLKAVVAAGAARLFRPVRRYLGQDGP